MDWAEQGEAPCGVGQVGHPADVDPHISLEAHEGAVVLMPRDGRSPGTLDLLVGVTLGGIGRFVLVFVSGASWSLSRTVSLLARHPWAGQRAFAGLGIGLGAELVSPVRALLWVADVLGQLLVVRREEAKGSVRRAGPQAPLR